MFLFSSVPPNEHFPVILLLGGGVPLQLPLMSSQPAPGVEQNLLLLLLHCYGKRTAMEDKGEYSHRRTLTSRVLLGERRVCPPSAPRVHLLLLLRCRPHRNRIVSAGFTAFAPVTQYWQRYLTKARRSAVEDTGTSMTCPTSN